MEKVYRINNKHSFVRAFLPESAGGGGEEIVQCVSATYTHVAAAEQRVQIYEKLTRGYRRAAADLLSFPLPRTYGRADLIFANPLSVFRSAHRNQVVDSKNAR